MVTGVTQRLAEQGTHREQRKSHLEGLTTRHPHAPCMALTIWVCPSSAVPLGPGV